MSFKQISTEETNDLMAKKDCIILDVRDVMSYEAAHISNAIQVKEEDVEQFIGSADKTKPLICYCFHGHSSQMAAQFFVDQGFADVYSMDGGFEAWRHEYPSVND